MAVPPQVAIRRAFGIADDATAGGTCFDDLTVAGEVPESTIWWPVTGGTIDKGLTRVDRNDEVRGIRAGTSPLPLQASPSITVPVPAYRSVLEKLLPKTLGGTDVVTGSSPWTHTFEPLGFGAVAIPAIHSQLIRDSLNQKMSGGAINRLAFNFPFDAEGTVEFDVQGLYVEQDAGAAPTITFTDVNDVFLLRDAQLFIEGTSDTDEVQTFAINGTPTGGDLTLTYKGATTVAIAFDAVASVVETALNNLLTIGTSGVSVTGGPLPDTGIIVTFDGTEFTNTDLPQLGLDDNTTGGSPAPTNVETTKGGGTGDVVDLQGFTFQFVNNVEPKHYAKANVETRTFTSGVAIASQAKKLWWPSTQKLGSAADVTWSMALGNTDQLREIAHDFTKIEKFQFTVDGGPITGGTESMTITIYNGAHTGGGADALTRTDDITSNFDGGAFYSTADATDIDIALVNASATPLT